MDTGGRLAVLEQRFSPAGHPPRHVHANEDEAFYVLDGRLAAAIATTTRSAPGRASWCSCPEAFRTACPRRPLRSAA